MNRPTMAVTAALLAIAASLEAKRPAPVEVKPLDRDGVQYIAGYLGARGAPPERGGYVTAWDGATGKRLWHRHVYRVAYDDALEADVQDVFITRLGWSKGRLVIDNELGERYEMDPATGEVQAVSKKSDRTEPASGPTPAARPTE